MLKNLPYHNINISYSVYGSGKPVMLLHGFGEDSTIWQKQVDVLKEKFLIITPDLPGSGQSDFLQKENVQLEDYAAILKALLQQEKIEKCILIGHSMGGYITMAFAEKYPQMLAAFGLFHSTATADDTEKIATRKKAIEFIQQNGSQPFLKTIIPGLFMNPEISEPDINLLIDKADNFKKEALVQYYQAMINRPDRTAVLKNSSVPVLFIIGVHDKVVPFNVIMQQTHLPQISFIHILQQAAHMGMLEETGKTNKILADFLEMKF
jgi:pimeloyl-ACP methyl ester carboxylesterase